MALWRRLAAVYRDQLHDRESARTALEVAASLARQAVAVSGANDGEAEKTRLFSRLFANETAELVSSSILTILRGSDVFDPDQVSAFLAETSHAALADSYQGIIPDMDRAADIIFDR